jgi:hypothetical protein
MTTPVNYGSFIWSIDDSDKIVRVNDAWLAFAGENGAPELTADAVVNQFIWRFMGGREIIYLYKQIFDRLRGGQSPVSFPFRCDSPEWRRFMDMHLSLLPGGGIQFRADLLRQDRRVPGDPLDAPRDRTREFMKICSWCKKIDIPGQGWGEMEAAIEALDLFGHYSMPRMTHTICEACSSAIRPQLNQEPGASLKSP